MISNRVPTKWYDTQNGCQSSQKLSQSILPVFSCAQFASFQMLCVPFSLSLYAGEIFFAIRYFGLSLLRQEEVVVSDLWRRSNKELVVGILKSDYTNFSGEWNLKMQHSLSNIWTSIPCAAMGWGLQVIGNLNLFLVFKHSLKLTILWADSTSMYLTSSIHLIFWRSSSHDKTHYPV